MNLRVSNADLVRGVLRIETSKNGEGREVALTPDLKVLLAALIVGHAPDDRLFPIKNPRYLWERLCRRAGIACGRVGGVIMHDARRTTARAKRAAGVPQAVMCTTMGWNPNSAMPRRYGIVDTADILDAQLRQEHGNGHSHCSHGHKVGTMTN
jgi:hypothetical protein